jgi:hypothetical protein
VGIQLGLPISLSILIVSHPLLFGGGVDYTLTDNADSIFVGSTIGEIKILDIVVCNP